MTVKIRDVIAAEEALEQAEREFRELNDNPSQWSAFESMDKRGKRTLNVTAAHFERRDAALNRINAARSQLLEAKRGFLAGVIGGDDAAV
jgi:hypothetical protein